MPVQVITPATFSDLVLPQVLRDELGISSEDGSDERLERLIRQATARIARYCNRPTFGRERVRQTEHMTAYPFGRDGILLERDLSPTIVTLDHAGTALVADDWLLDGAVLHRLRGGLSSLWHGGTVTITYDAGFAMVEQVPPDLEQACIILCRQAWGGRARDPGLRSIRIMDLVEKSYFQSGADTGMPPDVAEMLEPWRRLSCA